LRSQNLTKVFAVFRPQPGAMVAARLRALITDGLESGEGLIVTDAVVDELRDRAFSDGP